MNALPWTIYLSFAGALLCYLAGPRRPSIVRALALTSALEIGRAHV